MVLSSLPDFDSDADADARDLPTIGMANRHGFDMAFVDRANDLMGAINLQGHFTYVNVPLQRLTQHPEQDLVGRPALDLVAVTHRLDVRAFYARQIERRITTTYYELPVITQKKRTVWLALHAHLQRRGSRVAGLQIVARDLTERKQLEASLEHCEARGRQLFDECPAAIFMASPDGHLRACNPAFVRLAGFTSIADAIGSDLRTLYPHDHLSTLFERVRAEGAVHEEEAELKRVDARVLHIVQTLIGRFDEHEKLTAIVGYLIDDTPRKALQTQVRHAMKMEAVGRIAGGLAHDFNNLLMIINGLAEGLIERLPESDASRMEAEQILEAGKRGAALASQLLNASRKQAGAQASVFDIDDVMRAMKPMLAYLVGPGVVVEIGGTNEPKWISADRGQIEQVLLNLATNARDAMPQGGNLMIYTATADRGPETLRGAAATRRVVLTIHDTGVGMTPDTQTRIFEPFFTTKDRGKGTGLGLWQVQTIIEENGGFIDVHSVRRAGTTFTVSLPLAPVPADATAGNQARENGGGAIAMPPPPPPETILVVDDEAPVRVLLADALRRLGYQVLTAEDAAAALTLLREHRERVRLLLTDMVMPGKSGRDLAREAQQLNPNLPVLLISGYPDRSIGSEAGRIPRSAFLQKPFALDVLALRVRQMLDDRE
jgi:two-component system cell cycle sensor histidine kinase/response regulator CckA